MGKYLSVHELVAALTIFRASNKYCQLFGHCYKKKYPTVKLKLSLWQIYDIKGLIQLKIKIEPKTMFVVWSIYGNCLSPSNLEEKIQ